MVSTPSPADPPWATLLRARLGDYREDDSVVAQAADLREVLAELDRRGERISAALALADEADSNHWAYFHGGEKRLPGLIPADVLRRALTEETDQ